MTVSKALILQGGGRDRRIVPHASSSYPSGGLYHGSWDGLTGWVRSLWLVVATVTRLANMTVRKAEETIMSKAAVEVVKRTKRTLGGCVQMERQTHK